MVIDNTREADKREERQLEEKKAENRRDVEKRMQQQPMKTFEAKLAEKTAHEMTSKESAFRQAHDQKTNKKEQQSLLDKIIGTVKSKETEKEKTKTPVIPHEVEEEGKEEKEQRLAERSRFGEKKAVKERASDKKAATENVDVKDSKKGERSSEGHKRVTDKTEEQGEQSSGGSGGGQGSGSDSNGQSGFSFDQQSKNQGKENQFFQKKGKLFNKKIAEAKKAGGDQKGFQRDARGFSVKDLDEIVASVQLGINEQGEEEFSVELSDEYFDGLKVTATNTEEGVVLKFVCPNSQVLSTFLKYRPKVYARFKAKGISIVRIDVV